MDFFGALFTARLNVRDMLVLAAGMATACAFAEDVEAPSPWQKLVNAIARSYRASAVE